MFPWMAVLCPPIVTSVCSLPLSPAARESPAPLRLSAAHIWPSPHGPSQLGAPGGPEPWPRPQLSSCCLGLGPSLTVHTPSVPVFPQNVASAPRPPPRARLQNAETMEAPSQISNRPAIKPPPASACTSGGRSWQLRPQTTWFSHPGQVWALVGVEGRELRPKVWTPGFESQARTFLAAWRLGQMNTPHSSLSSVVFKMGIIMLMSQDSPSKKHA